MLIRERESVQDFSVIHDCIGHTPLHICYCDMCNDELT